MSSSNSGVQSQHSNQNALNNPTPQPQQPIPANSAHNHAHLNWGHQGWQQQPVSQQNLPNNQPAPVSNTINSAHPNGNNNTQATPASVAGPGAPPTRRAPIACRRCRRLRTKCVHENAQPPCQSCQGAGPEVAAECAFAARGRQDNDREFRRKRFKVSETNPRWVVVKERQSSVPIPKVEVQPSVIDPRLSSAHSSQDPWDLLPPYDELVEGCKTFGTSCIQLGFMPKALFLERLAKDRRSISPFLLLSKLSISARFTPSLIRRYGGEGKASEHFINLASQLVPDEMYEPTLERTQAFFLLGVAEWGRGARNRSSIHMGIAVRMAGILRLHREETYNLPKNATADNVVDSEVARRTFWCIECHDNLYTGYNAPISFTRTDITTLLPCEESDFAFGRIPTERGALCGTQAAKINPSLCSLKTRSLFGTLIQVHNLWGQVARRACRTEREKEPWKEWSEFTTLTTAIRIFEDSMPDRHRWSIWNFRGYKAEAVELAYLSIVTITRLNNIVIRRVYLEDIMHSALASSDSNSTTPAPPNFWANVSFELFTNLGLLYEQIDTFFTLHSNEEGYPTMLVFCTYICGSLASYLWKWPSLCPTLASGADKMLQRSLEVLTGLEGAWPHAKVWLEALRKVALPMRAKKAQTRPLSAMNSQERFLCAVVNHPFGFASCHEIDMPREQDGLDCPSKRTSTQSSQSHNHASTGSLLLNSTLGNGNESGNGGKYASSTGFLDPALVGSTSTSNQNRGNGSTSRSSIQQEREILNTESLNLLSNVAVDHLQQTTISTSQSQSQSVNGIGNEEEVSGVSNMAWNHDDEASALSWNGGDDGCGSCDGNGGLPNDSFEADLSEFLQGHVGLGLMEGWS